ncbi:hypothetical protein HMPREF0765_3166 [Sphingobacterium spiritivorum ATCC 33300]|uniref:Uncharacterized protein n=1 Tax=Sphingobacterium spiritivorum ATCC 33300 TaxID=525372 RepID=C2G0R0_SPHSI|nr:hypothetical protein HMPREF0765_3166 [Sphingobacterium spiritivorum ATCC 33300]
MSKVSRNVRICIGFNVLIAEVYIPQFLMYRFFRNIGIIWGKITCLQVINFTVFRGFKSGIPASIFVYN